MSTDERDDGYHLWHPSWVAIDPPTFEAYLTLGEQILLGRGDDELIRRVLDRSGVRATPRAASVTVCRSNYFGERSLGTWRDRWDLVWRIDAELAAGAPLFGHPRGSIELSAFDPSFFQDGGNPEDWAAWRCVVLADVPDDDALAALRPAVAARAPAATITTGFAFDRWHQLRIDLGPRPRACYVDGAIEAEALVTWLAAAGASVHVRDTLDRLEAELD